jgi:hypothetical protein
MRNVVSWNSRLYDNMKKKKKNKEGIILFFLLCHKEVSSIISDLFSLFVCHLSFFILFVCASQERVCYEKCQALEDNDTHYVVGNRDMII